MITSLDSEKTYRIFENLIVNITKYAMAQTRVYIEMKEFPDKVSISMKNVSATELDFDVNEITDRFVRGDSSRNTEGSGLGLAIAKNIVDMHGGTIGVTSDLNGTVFTVKLKVDFDINRENFGSLEDYHEAI